jgi:hypothetical protein
LRLEYFLRPAGGGGLCKLQQEESSKTGGRRAMAPALSRPPLGRANVPRDPRIAETGAAQGQPAPRGCDGLCDWRCSCEIFPPRADRALAVRPAWPPAPGSPPHTDRPRRGGRRCSRQQSGARPHHPHHAHSSGYRFSLQALAGRSRETKAKNSARSVQ